MAWLSGPVLFNPEDRTTLCFRTHQPYKASHERGVGAQDIQQVASDPTGIRADAERPALRPRPCQRSRTINLIRGVAVEGWVAAFWNIGYMTWIPTGLGTIRVVVTGWVEECQHSVPRVSTSRLAALETHPSRETLVSHILPLLIQ